MRVSGLTVIWSEVWRLAQGHDGKVMSARGLGGSVRLTCPFSLAARHMPFPLEATASPPGIGDASCRADTLLLYNHDGAPSCH